MHAIVKVWLHDILESIGELTVYFSENDDIFLLLSTDHKTFRAVERNLEIIGEAAYRITRVEKAIPISDVEKIISTRNRIIHGYDAVTPEILATIITDHLPLLEREVTKLLKENFNYLQ